MNRSYRSDLCSDDDLFLSWEDREFLVFEIIEFTSKLYNGATQSGVGTAGSEKQAERKAFLTENRNFINQPTPPFPFSMFCHLLIRISFISHLREGALRFPFSSIGSYPPAFPFPSPLGSPSSLINLSVISGRGIVDRQAFLNMEGRGTPSSYVLCCLLLSSVSCIFSISILALLVDLLSPRKSLSRSAPPVSSPFGVCSCDLYLRSFFIIVFFAIK